MNKIFISHSSYDKSYVGYLIRLLEDMEVPSGKIFCSSFEGYGIPLGEYFIERLKEELNENVLVLFLLSNNFYRSPICLCEMGATWIKTNMHIPILIPPFGFDDMKGVVSNTQSMAINDRPKLNSLYNQVRKFFSINEFDINRWERRRDTFIFEVNKLIKGVQNIHGNTDIVKPVMHGNNSEYQKLLRQREEEVSRLRMGINELKNLSENSFTVKYGGVERLNGTVLRENPERSIDAGSTDKSESEQADWGECPVEYEKFQQLMVGVKDKLDKLPFIVRKALFYFCAEKEFILNNSEDTKEFESILEAVEDDYLLLEGRTVIINIKDPKIRKTVEALNGLACFLKNVDSAFCSWFEAKYEICAKIESRKFWTTMGMF
ncbi:MAG: toll/interleukin-1 receptor domain-containing protein [Clostridia bacterium]|nr:toll/interleukin-1 receptor domain-containing protein [Clostridia bacterium]